MGFLSKIESDYGETYFVAHDLEPMNSLLKIEASEWWNRAVKGQAPHPATALQSSIVCILRFISHLGTWLDVKLLIL